MKKIVTELRILILENAILDAEQVTIALRNAGLIFTSLRVDTREAFEQALDRFQPHIVLADYKLPTYSGMEALTYTRRQYPRIPVIIVTEALGEETAVELLKCGARDYVLKKALFHLPPVVRQAFLDEQGIRQRKLTEEKYRALFTEALDGIVMIDAITAKIAECNPAFEKMTGSTIDELKSIKIWTLSTPEKLKALKKSFLNVKKTGSDTSAELELQRHDGSILSFEHSATIINLQESFLIQVIVRDISERKAIEREQQRLNRALRLLSDCNMSMINAPNEQTLLIDICRLVVEVGDYVMAWVGFAEQDAEKSVTPIAQSGYEDGYLETIRVSWDENLEIGRGPSGMAVRTGKTQVNQHCLTNPNMAPWREAAIRRGYQSSIGLPLIYNKKTIGVLTIYAAAPDAFTAEEVTLLEEMATNLAFGIETLRMRIKRLVTKATIERERNRLAAILQTASDGIHIIDSNGLLVDANDAFLNMLGLDKTAIGRVHVLDFAFQFPQEMLETNIRNLIANPGRSIAIEAKHRHCDGRILDVEITSRAVRIDEQDFIYASSRDITERKKAETALRESEIRYRLLVDNMNDGVAIYQAVDDGQDFVFKEFNKSGEKMSDLSRDQVIGRRVTEMFPNVAEIGLLEVMQRVYRSGKPEQLGDTYYHDGRISHWVSNDVYRLPTGEIVAIYENITERKIAEEQIRKLSMAVEQSPVSIVITDLDGNIEYVNETFFQITGYNREEVIGQNPRILQSGKTPTERYNVLWDDLTQGQTWRGEFINRRKDGSEYTEFANITPIRQSDGHISHYLAVKLDISEKKRLAQELEEHRNHLEELVEIRTHQLEEAKQAAEAANAAKSSFVANMSHEIRTPLNAIIGLTHLLRCSHIDLEQKTKLEKITDASHHLLSVINDILDFSKIEAGKLNLDIADFALDCMLDNVISMIKPKLNEKGLEIFVERDALPLVLIGDSTRLAQGLLNYLSNAVKFTQQGQIIVRLSKTEETATDLLARFEVIDTGIGIAPEKLANLFIAFEQVDTSVSRRYGGTGLGLAITQRLACLMGGEAGAQSLLGHGSTFWFTARLGKSRLDLEALTHSPTIAEQNLKNLSNGAHILLVEDNKINQEVALELLSMVGLNVEVANDGLEALEKAKVGNYDLILMDMQMPNMDGLEATRAIRLLPHGATLPILAMTANAFDDDREHCKMAGMNDFIAKPIEPEQLYNTLSRWLPIKAVASLSSKTEGLPLSLTTIPGLNTERGLTLLNGNIKIYLRLLRLYATDHVDDITKFREQLAQGNQNEAWRLIHSLRGSSGNLGATEMQHLTAELEAEIRKNNNLNEIERLANLVETHLQQFIIALRAALPEETTAIYSEEIDWTIVRWILTELELLLTTFNMEANELIEMHATLLKYALGSLGEELEQHIDYFLYPAALETMKQIWCAYSEQLNPIRNMVRRPIWIESTELGKDAIQLKIAQKTNAPISIKPSFENIRVLIVDDNETSREILNDMLHFFQLEVSVVNNGAAAITQLKQAGHRPFDVVLMDWHMPSMDGIETTELIRTDATIAKQPQVIMITAYDNDDVIKLAKSVGINHFLVKPVSSSMLFDTLLSVVDEEKVQSANQYAQTSNSEKLLGNYHGAQVLLVEDNEINREIVGELLRSLHIALDEAKNGAEALAMVQQHTYDAVLMDVQMPVMDGIEATQHIRDLARQLNSNYLASLPIIAMTSMDTAQDVENCECAGMTEHLAKPIMPQQLSAILLKHFKTSNRFNAPRERKLKNFDFAKGVHRTGDNVEAYFKQLHRFRNHYANAMEELQHLITTNDLKAAEIYCHGLKGVCGMLDATELFASVTELDNVLKQGRIPKPKQLKTLRQMLQNAVTEIDSLITTTETQSTSNELNYEQLSIKLRNLDALLEIDIGTAEKLVTELHASIPIGCGIECAILEIMSEIDRFEIDNARLKIRDLLQSLCNGQVFVGTKTIF